MEPNNELSELMIRYEPVFPCQKKGNHTPQKSRKYMKNRQIGGDQIGEIVWFININARGVYVTVTGYHTSPPPCYYQFK